MDYLLENYLFFAHILDAFFLINSYTTGISNVVLQDILKLTVSKKYKGKVSSGEIGLPMEESKLILPCGIYGRWEK